MLGKAYVTLLSTNDYVNGVLYLADNLKRVESQFPLYCIIDKTISKEVRRLLITHEIGIIEKPIIPVDEQIKEINKKRGLGVWNTIFQKLWIYDLPQFEKVVYLDGDMMILENVDELFEYPDMSIVIDPAYEFKVPMWENFTKINAGLIVVDYVEGRLEKMLELLESKKNRTETGTLKDIVCDQSILQDYLDMGTGRDVSECTDSGSEYDSWYIDNKYNTFFAYLEKYKKDPKIIHLAGMYNAKLFLPTFDRGLTTRFTHQQYVYASMYFTALDEITPRYKQKILSIIIPHYKESEELIGGALGDIDRQIGLDFDEIEVLVVEDYPEKPLDIEFITSFKNCDITQVHHEVNQGVSIARQTGINNSVGTYFMFLDADDRLAGNLVLRDLIVSLKTNPAVDIVRGMFLQESPGVGKISHYRATNDITWLHGKIYRRGFVEKYKIQFPADLKYNEDSYYNGVLFNLDINIADYPYPITVWRFNEESLTRTNHGRLQITGYPDYIKGRYMILGDLKPHVPMDRWIAVVVRYMVHFYLEMQPDDFYIKGTPEEINHIEKLIWDYRKYFKECLETINRGAFEIIYNEVRGKFRAGSGFIEKETFFEFYARLADKFGQY